MKRKIYSFFVCILLIFSLSSCDFINNFIGDEPQVDSSIDTTQITTKYSDVYNKVYQSCYGVRNEISSTSSRIGSCVCIKKDDTYSYFLTNRHVIEADDRSKESTNLSIFFGNGEYYAASLVACTSYSERIKNESMDLAILKIKTPRTKTIDVAIIKDDVVTKGQDVLAIGCPHSLEFYNTLTVGVVSKVNSTAHLIQHQATINPGNSGGGLFNLQGRLIGINVSKLAPDNEIIEGIGFAIDIERVRLFCQSKNFTL